MLKLYASQMVSKINTYYIVDQLEDQLSLFFCSCLSDAPSKTATGTIAIQVEDFNDHCPTLTATTQTLCFEHTAVYVTAVDRDEAPNSAPFEFTVIQGSAGKWMVEHLNGKTDNELPLD